MNDVTIVDSLEPYCFKTSYQLDFPRLLESVHVLLSRMGYSMHDIIEKINRDKFGHQLNLTHLPNLSGNYRWLKHSGNHSSLQREGVDEKDFTEFLTEMQDLYIGQVVRDVYEQHDGTFQGRASLVWLAANRRYEFHRDLQSPNRYHIPLITNEECYFLFRNETTHRLHMPTGNVWYLDPIGIEHTFINNSTTHRLHLLLTSAY